MEELIYKNRVYGLSIIRSIENIAKSINLFFIKQKKTNRNKHMCKDSFITAEDQLRTKGLNKRRNSRGDLILNNNFIL